MIALGNLSPGASAVVRRIDVVALDALQVEAAGIMEELFEGVSGKRINGAALPGFGRHGISRAANGCATNPLFRVVGLFVLMRRLGMSGELAQRIIDWMQEVKDAVFPAEDLPPLEEVLDREADLDAEDDPHQQRIGRIPGAAARMLTAKRRQHAFDRTVIQALRRHVEAEAASR